MTLEEVIKQRLAEANIAEAKVIDLKKVDPEVVGAEKDVVVTDPKKKVLTKESLDEMSEEEFDSIDEEQLDELSVTTLNSYREKSLRQASKAGGIAKALHNRANGDQEDQKYQNTTVTDPKVKFSGDAKEFADTSKKRYAGAKQAATRISTKESLDAMSDDGKNKSVSEQVSALLEVEGLSEEFKTQAVTIFEAAVTDRVMQIEESLKEEFDSQLAEAKSELDNDIDGFLSEAIQQWAAKNEIAIKANFNSQLAESFVDGVKALMAEHNIELPADKENALEVALSEVDSLKESIAGNDAEKQALVEQVNEMKSEKILVSFAEKMTQTEFDRFSQLTESVKFVDEVQYAKQLNVVLENFGSDKKKKPEITVVETSTTEVNTLITETNSDVDQYAQYINNQVR